LPSIPARSRAPPDRSTALATAGIRTDRIIVTLTEPHLVHDQAITASDQVRVLTTQRSRRPTRRPPASPTIST
jgi:hypothetical protein